MKTLVCVFAHPDDEAFGPGGTIAKFSKTHNVYVLCATKGEGGGSGKVRARELRASAKILGVKKVYFLGFEDGTLSNNLYHELASKIRNKLLKFRPGIIITFEPQGVSGHIDHITVSMVTSFVVQKLPFVKTVLQFCRPERFSKARQDYFIYFPPGYKRSEVDKVINISEVWETKVKAMLCHKSQIPDVKRILELQQKLPKEEYFLVLKKS